MKICHDCARDLKIAVSKLKQMVVDRHKTRTRENSQTINDDTVRQTVYDHAPQNHTYLMKPFIATIVRVLPWGPSVAQLNISQFEHRASQYTGSKRHDMTHSCKMLQHGCRLTAIEKSKSQIKLRLIRINYYKLYAAI